VRNTTINPDQTWRAAWWILGLAVLILAVAIRIRLLGIPLERDEGEYAYAGQLMLQGIPPYKLAYNMKFPGTYAAYAVMMSIFGQTANGIHLGLLMVNAASIALVFFLGRRLMNATAGIVAAASYAVLSVNPSVLGFAGHATHFVILPVLGGCLLLLRSLDRPSTKILFVAGLLFGIGLLMKQPAFFFILFGASYLFYRDCRAGLSWKQRILRNAVFNCGAVLPFGITCFLLWRANVFAKFWFWTIDYARQYAGLVSVFDGGKILIHNLPLVIASDWPLWALAGLELMVLVWDNRMRTSAGFLVGLLVFSMLAICPGLYFRMHYFILVLPAFSLLAGAAIAKASSLLSNQIAPIRLIPIVLFGAALSLPIFRERSFFFDLSPVAACRAIYLGPFPESVRVASYIRDHTTADDLIAVLGSEPQIYFYSNRHSASGYIYTYGLMEMQKYANQMQRDMIREIEVARPKYLISVVMNDSWLKQSGSNQLIFTWANNYAAQNYTVVGFVNMVTPDRTDYYFGSIPPSVPVLRDYILIYERKS